MTQLPVPAFEGLDPVAVGAPDDALVPIDLGLHGGDDLVRVTLTLFARRVSIRAENDPEGAS